MDKVRKLIDAGASIPGAIREALGMPLSEFAAKHGRSRTAVSLAINGAARPTDADVAALIAELGGCEDEWRELLWQAAKPVKIPA